jgi:NADPH2:quinone reductase
MRAFVINKYAHPSQIRLADDAPEPKVGHEDVIIEVYSAGLNFYDVRCKVTDCVLADDNIAKPYLQILQSQGKYQTQPPFPFVLGSEYAGRIAAHSPIPKGCPFKPGDRVFGVQQGAYADRIATNWKEVIALPKSMSFDQGAGVS